MAIWEPDSALAAYHAGVTVICELAARLPDDAWAAAAFCPGWRAADLAGHLLCVADDYHEYLDDAPGSRMARLMATGADAGRLARKLARQNTAELAALPDVSGPEYIRAFAVSARGYARRV
ncbi:MAG: maleylpyruvate isomerase N-terminal domain-containing protein, partial [Actinobacteria bacterium]|nr:maleylpyruvate isomerase N-terminal domain-containing protein [Actinomycetota bacterium]